MKYFFVYMEVQQGEVVATCKALRQITDLLDCRKDVVTDQYSDTGVALNQASYVTKHVATEAVLNCYYFTYPAIF